MLRRHLRFVERASRKLSRAVWYALLRERQAFQEDQGRQNRIETAGEDLLLIALMSLYAAGAERTEGNLAEEVIREARLRVNAHIRGILRNQDSRTASVGIEALRGAYPSLSAGIIERNLEDYRAPADTPPSDVAKQEHAVA
jgi:hypothetical protein